MTLLAADPVRWVRVDAEGETGVVAERVRTAVAAKGVLPARA